MFGVGVGLTVDEFALWLHMEDVYWTSQGRKSVDAVFCVLVVTGALIGGADLVSGRVGTTAWWSSVTALAINLLLSAICLLKGKVTTGVIGILISIVALVGAIRLAKPGSWWAAHRYASRPQRAARATHRYDQRYQQRWNRLRDLVAGAPPKTAPPETLTHRQPRAHGPAVYRLPQPRTTGFERLQPGVMAPVTTRIAPSSALHG
jgi:hypothetical protein